MTATLVAPATFPDPWATTGPELLLKAAELLPAATDGREMSSSYLHVAVYKAALGTTGCSAGEAHLLAGEAIEMLVAYLAALHNLQDVSAAAQFEAMKTWAFRRNVGAVAWAMRAAAEHWRAELLFAAFAPAGGESR